MKRYFFVALIALFTTTFALASGGCQPSSIPASPDRAAIIDQLYVLESNPAFVDKTREMLESYGFAVDLWQGEEVTVDFYRELPKLGYKLILFRVHSGLLLSLVQSQIAPSETTYLFTGENYTTTRYVSEQLTDRVSNAMMTTEYPLVFAVNSEFIREVMEGSFDNTVILMMGCESFYRDDMAEAFIKKGASAYLGWSDVVSLKYVDEATLSLLSNLCSANMTVEQGIDQTMAELGYDPYFHSYLKYYPADSGSYTISELIN